MARRALIPAFIALVLVVGIAGVIGLATSSGPDPVASLEELREEEVIFLDEHDIYLVYNEGEPLALSTDAQHTGDEVEFCASSQMFESPAHGEKFDIRGYYYGGPARSGLNRYPVRVEGDGVYVDVDHPMGSPPRGAGPAREPEGSFCVS
ncbi:MAG: Rieske (2Fe-2S) protein [Actinomycetota bacterium]